MNKQCTVCKSVENKVVFKEFEIDILRCLTCGHVFSSYNVDQHHDGYFDDTAVESEDQFWWNEAHQRMYDDFCRRFVVSKSGALLDLGCGLGYFVQKIAAFSSWQAFGYEISPRAVDFARTRLGLKNVFCGRLEDSKFDPHSFDIITLWDVIEHIPDPDPLLSSLSSLVKEDGMLFIHTPNVHIQLPKARIKKMLKGMNPYVHYLEAKDHVNLYSPKTLTLVLARNGFHEVEFIHLRPIQSVSGSRNQLLRSAKNAWFYLSVASAWMTFGRVNIDNLFAVARRRHP